VLFEYADALGVAFAPFVQTVAQTTIPLIQYQHSAAVRQSCGFIFPGVFHVRLWIINLSRSNVMRMGSSYA
jgi:hypothetical protein